MTKQTIDHAGFQYEVDKIYSYVAAGMKESDAVHQAYPALPKKSIAPIIQKVKKHPYYLARKDMELAIMAEKGPELQQHALDLAFNARSQMVQADMTKFAIEKVYKTDQNSDPNKPQFVFNFSFGNAGDKPDTPDRIVVDQDPSHG
jgi:hypothetical protein